MKIIVFIGLYFFLCKNSFAQSSVQDSILLAVGRPCPQFHLKEVAYFNKENVSLTDFKDHWLIIDCWNRYCSSCIASLPRTDSLQKEFPDVNILMVGYTGSQYFPSFGPDEKEIKKLYVTIRDKKGLSLPIAFDSTLFRQFDIGPCPFIIVIDPKGIVRGITYRITNQDMKKCLAGECPLLPRVYRKHERKS